MIVDSNRIIETQLWVQTKVVELLGYEKVRQKEAMLLVL